MISKDNIIKILREEKGLSQEELAGDICSVSNLSKIENGTQIPSASTYRALLESMGEDPEKYSLTMSKREKEAADLEYNIMDYMDEKDYSNAVKALDKLEEIKKLSSESKKFIKYARLSIKSDRDFISCEETISEIKEILGKKLENFKNKNVSRVLLTKADIQLLNFLACSYFDFGNAEEGIRILKKLKEYIEVSVADKRGFALMYTVIAYNLSKHLALNARLEEAIDVSEDGLKWCKKYERHASIDGLLINKGLCLLDLGKNKEEAKELLKLSYLTSKFLGEYDTCKRLVDHLKSKGVETDFLVSI